MIHEHIYMKIEGRGVSKSGPGVHTGNGVSCGQVCIY